MPPTIVHMEVPQGAARNLTSGPAITVWSIIEGLEGALVGVLPAEVVTITAAAATPTTEEAVGGTTAIGPALLEPATMEETIAVVVIVLVLIGLTVKPIKFRKKEPY